MMVHPLRELELVVGGHCRANSIWVSIPKTE